MQLSEFWACQNLIKTLYAKCVEPVCEEHGLTRTELDILLFLANNPSFDTASDITERRKLAKSHVSTSVKSLEGRGFLTRCYTLSNRKTAHLSLCATAMPAVLDGREAQNLFLGALLKDFSEADLGQLKQFLCQIAANVQQFTGESPNP